MHESQPGQPEPDFDAFLNDLARQAEQHRKDEALLVSARQVLIKSLKENGAHLLVGSSGMDKDYAEAALAREFQATYREQLLDEYSANELLQEQLQFQEFADRLLDASLRGTIEKQHYLLDVATASILIAENQPDYSIVTHDKKHILTTLLVQGHISGNDAWYQTFNAVLPGDQLDLNNPSDQLYLIDALEQYAQGQVTE